jgi:hypothetical protein
MVTRSDTNRVVRLTSLRTELEAAVVVGALEEHGIRATMSGIYTANFRTEAPGWVEVLVDETDLARAQNVLNEVRADQGDIDWEDIDVGQPEQLEDPRPYRWFPIFRRVCLGLVIAYLVWVCIGMMGSLVHIANDITK